MENRAHALVAGLFTLLLGAAVIAALFWFGEQRLPTHEVLMVTRQNVGGLNPEAQVRYRGIRVGKVLDIRLDPEDAGNTLILTEIDESVPLTRGVTARLAYQGITGIAHILLEDDGRDKRPLLGQTPRVVMQASLFDELEDSLPAMLAESRQLLHNLNALLGTENRDRLGATLVHLEATTRNASATMERLQTLLSDANMTELSNTLHNGNALLGETRQLVARLNEVSTRVDRLLQEGNSNGDLGTMAARVNRMSNELTAAARQLKRVLQQLETAPQSLLFGPAGQPPGPGEAGFAAPLSPAPEETPR